MTPTEEVIFDMKSECAQLPDGTLLNASLLSEICLGYECMCTANYLFEMYDLSEQTAWDLASEVRDLMDDYGLRESEAIQEVLMRNGGHLEKTDDYPDYDEIIEKLVALGVDPDDADILVDNVYELYEDYDSLDELCTDLVAMFNAEDDEIE